MNLNEIRELIQLMRDNQISEIDLEQQEGGRVRIVSAQAAQHFAPPPQAPPGTVYLTSTPGQVHIAPPPAAPESVTAGAKPVEKVPEGITINSPIVGTYYASPAPDLPAYVGVGDMVEEETVLCIVEAMKVMNEIKAEIKGRILEILIENGHPVEFGQPLFRVSAN